MKLPIVRWSPANPWWWGYQISLWGYNVGRNGGQY